MRRCPLTAVSQLGDKRRALVRPPFLGPFPCGASGAALDKAAWSFRVLPSDAVVSGLTSGDQYPEPPACRIGTAASSDIFHLPFSPLSRCYRAWLASGVVDVNMSFKPAQLSFKLEYSVRGPNPTLYSRGSSAMA